MFSFFKRNKSNVEVPEWAQPLSGEQYTAFIRGVEKYFAAKGISYTIEDGVIVTDSNPFGMGRMGLGNVLQVCYHEKPGKYANLINEHFSAMERAHMFDAEFKQMVGDYEQVKKYIAVRVYDDNYVNSLPKGLTISRNIAGDIHAVLVFDLPDSIKTIQPEQAGKWNKTVDELLEIGKQNVRNNYPLDISKQNFGPFDLWFVNCEHFFAGNVLFELATRKELVGSKGVLIGVPHRHVALIYPIENIEMVKALNGLIPTVYGMNQEGPGSLSNNLLWYNDGTFTNLPYHVAEGKVQFYPPDNFVAMLNEMGA